MDLMVRQAHVLVDMKYLNSRTPTIFEGETRIRIILYYKKKLYI